MTLSLRFTFSLLLTISVAPFVAAQDAADLMKLLPSDFAVTVVVHDLKSNHARWEKSNWWKAFHGSIVGKRFAESPEMQQFRRWQDDLKKHFQLDWPTLRDDILGGTIVLSYSPGDKTKPDSERGIILVRATKAESLTRLVERLNELQKQTGELKSLTTLEHAGAKYHRRLQGGKAHYYAMFDSLFAITPNEDSLKEMLARRRDGGLDSPWIKRFRQAGIEGAIATLCVNPRKVEPDFGPGVKKTDELPSYWRALDAIFVTMNVSDNAELRVSIQAKTDELPAWARGSFTRSLERSELWDRLPERSLLTFAGYTDFVGAGTALRLLLPDKDRGKIKEQVPGIVFDMVKEMLPSLGPDWGACVLPAGNADELPRGLFALRVKPGSKKAPIEADFIQAIHLLVAFKVGEYNAANPNSPIAIRSAMRGKVEIKYLENAKFPRGFQPAWALKDGYLLAASSPDTFDDFRKTDAKAIVGKDTPILRLSTSELAKLLDQRRDHVLATLARQPDGVEGDAKRNLENVISLFQLFDTFTLSQHGAAGQTSWMLRLTPASAKN